MKLHVLHMIFAVCGILGGYLVFVIFGSFLFKLVDKVFSRAKSLLYNHAMVLQKDLKEKFMGKYRKKGDN